MATKILRVFQEFTSEGYVPMPPLGNIDYGYTIAGTFPSTTPATFQTDDPDLEVTVTEVTDFYVWIRSHGTEWNYQYTRNVRVYPDSPSINNVVMGIIIANLGNTVPYTGATQNVDLGEYGLSGGYIHLDNTPTTAPTTSGTIKWNDVDGTADLILKGGNVTNQIGQEINKRVVNKTGAILNEADFRAVRIRLVSEGGAQGQRLAVVLAQADSDTNSATTIGLVTETIANNDEGFITLIGEVKEIDTTGAKSYGGLETWVDGNILYLSPTHAGYLTNVKPQAPQHMIVIGFVSYAHAVHGKIDVKVDNGYELDELHNVKITTATENDFLVYDSSVHVWENRQVIKTNGYVPYFDSTDLFKQSPIYSNATKVAIGTTTFIGTNKLTIGGGIWAEEATINDQALISTNTLNGDFYISRWSGTAWDVFQTYSASKVLFSKDIEATKFIKTGGLHTQFLMADGLTETITNLSIITGGGSGGTNDGYLTRWNGLQTIQNSLMYETSAGFIGFGTTSPFKKFTVQGGAISVYSSSTNYGFMDTSNNSYSFTSANGFYFVANNIGTVASTTVDNTGKWGFGIGTPSYKVDVNGDVNTNGLYRVNGSQISTSNVLEGTNLYFTSNRVLNQVLTGLNPALSGTMTATDSLIEGLSKVQYQLNNKENTITAGTTAQYWRGDKTWQTLNASAVGATTVGGNLFTLTNPSAVTFIRINADNTISTLSASAMLSALGGQTALTNPITGTGTTNYLPKFTGSTTLGNSLVYDDGTNIGIGTTTPASLLHLNSSGSPYIRLQTTNGTGKTWGIGVDNAFSNGLNFSEIGVADGRLFIATGGNVGVGTTSPDARLTVKAIESAAKGISIWGRSDDLSTIRFYNNTGATQQAGFLSAPTYLGFTFADVEKMRLNSSGNLGLGVTPSAWTTWTSLQISGNAVLSGYNNNTIVANNWYYNAGDKYISNGYVSLYQQGNGAHTWYTAPSGTAGTAISFTQAMTLDASGRLMLGTTTPLGSATGRGNITINGNSSSILSLGISGVWKGYVYHDGTNMSVINAVSGNLSLGTADTERLRINATTGNVSIGNTNNTYKLDVSGDVNFLSNSQALRLISSANGNYITFHNGTSAYGYIGSNYHLTSGGVSTDLGIRSEGNLVFDSGGANTRLTIASTGKVGIGITSPVGLLHLYNSATTYLDIESGTASGIVRLKNGNYSGILSEISSVNQWYISGGGAVKTLTFGTDNIERVRIASTGNVGLGTTSPSAQLHATGSVIIGSAPSSVFKFNVNPTGSNFISFWIPTIGGVNSNGIISHGGGGYTNQLPLGYFATQHIFNGEVTGGGAMQVAGDVNITGSFRVNNVPITSGGGATSLAGLTDVSIASPTNGQILVYDSSTSKWKNQANSASGITGSGYTNYIPKFSGNTSLGNSNLFQLNDNTGILFNSTTATSLAGKYFAINDLNYSQFACLINNTLAGRFWSAANYSAFEEVRGYPINFYINTSIQFTIKSNTVNIQSIPSSTSGLSFGDLYVDANGFVKRYNVV